MSIFNTVKYIYYWTYTVNFKMCIRDMYAAVTKGFFEEEGIEVDIINTSGADKTMAALISGEAQVGLMGPEAVSYTHLCKRLSTGALKMENYKIVRDHDKCIGCGECVLNCPTSAWTRDDKKYYRLAIMGRTGKKNPRLAEDFLIWADEESIIKIILNTYKYVNEYIDKNAPGGKEHIGYIVDRTGFMEFKKWALEGIKLGDIVTVSENINWSGSRY